jgi:hypothetical protein
MEDDIEHLPCRSLGGSRYVCPCLTHIRTAPPGRLAPRRARPDHPPDRFHPTRTPRAGVRRPGPACSPSLHPDARRSPLEWRCHHRAASRAIGPGGAEKIHRLGNRFSPALVFCYKPPRSDECVRRQHGPAPSGGDTPLASGGDSRCVALPSSHPPRLPPRGCDARADPVKGGASHQTSPSHLSQCRPYWHGFVWRMTR